ncbi:hypothetical protein O2V63_01075 [Modestobacter sp. VKM Ac-2977]|uniref:hypothetical protein n=1 Tax=Modestobacter sp. VKM Ac-2977 TaxID=3004131 RepID=UPI0022AA76C6|nr:hypothetical protein [Modestobacter sp. VKM Ac-2977]MCZ2818922.1 hypothetical protein [Modestobacter sp. VKM Ac-2977]
MSDYILASVGFVPRLLGMPSALGSGERHHGETLVYRRDLLRRVECHLADINYVIDGLVESSVLADIIFVEGPDHEPYADAYTWEPVELELSETTVGDAVADEAPEIWR